MPAGCGRDTLLALFLLCAGPSLSERAAAQCPPHPLTTTPAASPLTSELITSTDFVAPRGFIASGTRLMCFDPAAGAWLWTVTLSDTIQGNPLPARMKNGTEVVFVSIKNSRFDCRLASNGAYVWERDLSVLPSDPMDRLATNAAFQSWASSDSSFQAQVPGDLVFVASRNYSTFNNRLYALNALDGTNRWLFNPSGVSSVAASMSGPVVDLTRNAVYLGTAQSSPIQNSLWALSTTNGHRVWTSLGSLAGGVSTQPLVLGDRLYSAGDDHVLRATSCGAAAGSPIWSLALASAAAGDLAFDDVSPSPLLVLRTADQVLRFVSDQGPYAAELPTLPGYVAGPVCVPGTGECLAVNTSGGVQEIDIAAHVLMGPPAAFCSAAAMFPRLAHLASLPSPWRMSVVVNGGSSNLLQLCVPWSYGAQPSGCVAGVSEEPSGPMARLEPPFPNPAHGATRLGFHTAYAARASLLVTDVQGRLVRRLAEDAPASGERSLAWAGDDNAGRRLPSGVNTVRLSLDGASVTGARKVLLLH